jgi:hypothetical protein
LIKAADFLLSFAASVSKPGSLKAGVTSAVLLNLLRIKAVSILQSNFVKITATFINPAYGCFLRVYREFTSDFDSLSFVVGRKHIEAQAKGTDINGYPLKDFLCITLSQNIVYLRTKIVSLMFSSLDTIIWHYYTPQKKTSCNFFLQSLPLQQKLIV